MVSKAYRSELSLTAHESLVAVFARALAQHWGQNNIQVSCDTAIARGVGQSRLEIPAMVAWDAFIGSQQMQELSLPWARRRYHRYVPFPMSVRDSLDEWTREIIKVSFHQQLLTGVVIYIDPEEVTQDMLDSLDCTALRNKIVLSAFGQYWRSKLDVTWVRAKDNASLVNGAFEQLWELQRTSRVMRLYYKYPHTFEPEMYYPDGIRPFVAYLQRDRCPCRAGCDLTKLNGYDIDHLVPRKQGGTNVLINLQATCAPYNRQRKRERPEPRPIDFAAIIAGADWRPRLSDEHRKVLLRQMCGPNDLEHVRRLFVGHATKVFQ
jgi:hypothetical protein